MVIEYGNGFDLAKLSHCYICLLTLCNTAVKIVSYEVINGKCAEISIRCFLRRFKSWICNFLTL